jgi:hypothetical protein
MPYADPQRNKEVKKARYLATKALWAKRQAHRRVVAHDYIWQTKCRLCCKRCGETNPIVLVFHHRDPTAKELCPADMVRDKWGPTRIQKELDKCDVLCANCHLIVHWELAPHKWPNVTNQVNIQRQPEVQGRSAEATNLSASPVCGVDFHES